MIDDKPHLYLSSQNMFFCWLVFFILTSRSHELNLKSVWCYIPKYYSRKAMGTVVSSILPGTTGRTDDPDPVTGLTSRDKYLVKTSWGKLMKDPTDTGVTLLSLFFEKYPQYLQLFPFKDLSPSEFSTDVRFRAHSTRVVYALSYVVDALNDNDLLIQLLTKLGSSHAPRNVTADGFIHLKEVAIELFSTLFKPEEMEAWKKTLEVAFSVIVKGLESAKQKENH